MASLSTRVRKKAMIEALEKNLGVVTAAAKTVGIHRDQHYTWMKTDPKYREAVLAIENVALDFAESKLFKQIENGDTTATIFFLKTKAKHRGYVERQEIVGGMSINWTEEKTYETNGKADDSPGLPGGPAND